MSIRKLRVALIGCGQIADAHLGEIGKIPRAELVAVCDRERDLALQAAARFDVPEAFDDVGQMLASAKPDVVHITTPPHTHRPLAIEVLRAGANAYVEKPFAVDLAEAEEIISAARSADRLVCVGHDHLFDPAWEECRDLERRGTLGRIVHIDSVQGYDLSGSFGSLVMGDPKHWVNRLPGGIFQNTISHAIYKITEFLPDDHPQMFGFWQPSSQNEDQPTELRILMRGAATTANLVVSCAARPVQRLARIYGTLGSVEVDIDTRLVRHYRALGWPGPFAKIEGPLRHVREGKRHLRRALRRFLKSELHYFTGMRNLFDRFYTAILDGGEPPIAYREICRVTEIMDEIFALCRETATQSSNHELKIESKPLAVPSTYPADRL